MTVKKKKKKEIQKSIDSRSDFWNGKHIWRTVHGWAWLAGPFSKWWNTRQFWSGLFTDMEK